MGRAKGHTHQYYTVKVAGTSVWACARADCNHYMPAHMSDTVKGKRSECNSCNDTTIMTPERMKLAIEKNNGRILCDDCMEEKITGIRPIHVDPDDILAMIKRGE